MAKLVPNNEETLRAILKLGEAGVHEVNAHLGFDARDAIRSLVQCEYIYITRTVMRETVPKNPRHKSHTREMMLYAITDRGRMLIQNLDFPPAKQMLALKVAKPQQLHRMETFVIPDRKPHVNEMVAKIGGREVRITYGVHHPYEVYRPAKDQSRNYTPKPLRSILAM
jgi:FlaA1/EpsC-like NDP-sugar epimerase